MAVILKIESFALNYDAKVPSLDVIFRVSPAGTIKILRFTFILGLSTGERFTLGQGFETPQMSSGQSVWQSQDFLLTSTLELGHEKVAIIDRYLSKISRDNDITFQVTVSCDYVRQMPGAEAGVDHVKYENHHQSFYHSVPRSHWDRWVTHWGKLQTVVAVSGVVARKLEELKERTGNLGYEELIGLLLDNFIPTKVALETLFVSTLPTKKDIKTRLEDMLSRAGKDSHDVLITGWIDGSITTLLHGLLGQGVTVLVLTRSSTEKGVTSAVRDLQKIGAEIRKNDMVHARIVIVGEHEVLVSSADPKASSLVDNREAGVYSSNPLVVRAARAFFEEVWGEVGGSEIPLLRPGAKPSRMPVPGIDN